MISDRCLNELRKIMEIDGITRDSGVTARKLALEGWISDWVGVLEVNQTFLDKNFTSEEEDYLKYHLAKRTADIIIEEFADVSRGKDNISLKVLAFKRKKP